MRISKIYLFSFIFLIVSIVYFGVVSSVAAEENVLVATGTGEKLKPAKPPTTQPQVVDCKAVETKGKDGKVVVNLDGKDCQKIVENLGTDSKVCCICRGDGSGTHWVCDGTCCGMAIGKLVKITPR